MILEDTIAAIATPPGRGAVAVLRVSGPEALGVVSRLAGGALPADAPRTARLLALRDPAGGELLDRALVTVFPAPASYTGENVVELHTHGGPLAPQLVLAALVRAGARPAEPGEFTRRAYLNGKLDLLQAEAVLDLIDGRSPALHRTAIHQLEGGLSRRIDALRESLLSAEALLVHAIDFPEEDDPPVPPGRILAATREVRAQIDAFLRKAPEGELLRDGALVVLAGKPNSGKSSLFNALLGRQRAIVTPHPGTTRDALEAELTIGEYPFRLVDTAGLRRTHDVVEGLGIEVARRYLDAAQLVLFCVEAGREPDAEEREFLDGLPPGRVVLVRTKADLVTPAAPEDGHAISALSDTGLAELRERLLAAAFGGLLSDAAETPLVTRARQRRALEEAAGEVDLFMDAWERGVPAEFSATHLRSAALALEALVGALTPDDVLGAVFSAFCVGK
jgi:tRNA modification GTPase